MKTTMPLYATVIPNSIPTLDEEQIQFGNAMTVISNITIPTLSIFRPQKVKANGTAIIICPGGGYVVVAAGNEGLDVAEKFNEIGVTVFVLKYRIPNVATMVNPEIGPLQDLQEAIRIVREGASEYNIDPDKIGIVGFSAGGHLAATAGTHFHKSVIDNPRNCNLRPDFLILIYPLISFTDALTNFAARQQLIGKNPSTQKITAYSNELHVTSETPPTFLVHATDDLSVKVQNSLSFYQALVENKVPAEMHIYQNGGHAFELNLPNEKELWMERCTNWMESNGLLQP